MSTPPSVPPAHPPRRQSRRWLGVVLVIACVGGGAGASLALRPPKPPAAPVEEPEAPAVAVAPPKPKPEPEPLPDLTAAAPASRVDTLIRAGLYAEALTECRDATRKPFGTDEAAKAYREGLCLEGQGKWKEADAAYQKAEADANVGAWARALLGRARCALATDARPFAWVYADRALLRSGHADCHGRIREEALHLRARVMVLDLGPVPPLDAFNPDALAWPSLHTAADKYLDWLPITVSESEPPEPNDGVEMFPNVAAPGGLDVTASLSERPAVEVLRAIATAAGLKLQAEGDAATRLAAPAGPVEVERLALNDLLASLCDSAGVAWAVQENTLLLTPAPRTDRSEAAADALRRALVLAPEHPAVGPTRVTLANLDGRASRTRSAARAYRQALEAVGNPPEATCAAYNLGLIELKEGNRAGAVSRFLEVIDRRPGTKWADLGWCWVARAHLDGDDIASARQAYRTAIDGRTPEASSAAALGLCACDLLENTGDPLTRVRETRFSSRESHALLANFYEALLRHRAAPSESRRELLLTALAAANPAAFGPAGMCLAGRVYDELGLTQQALDRYDAAAEVARGPLALRMTFEAADRYDRLDLRRQARTRFLALSAADAEAIGTRAELRLAALDAREGKGADAVRRSRAALARPGADRVEALSVMGRGYELLRKFGAAAECFAGRVPKE